MSINHDKLVRSRQGGERTIYSQNETLIDTGLAVIRQILSGQYYVACADEFQRRVHSNCILFVLGHMVFKIYSSSDQGLRIIWYWLGQMERRKLHLIWPETLQLYDICWVIWRERNCTSSDRQLDNIFIPSCDGHMASKICLFSWILGHFVIVPPCHGVLGSVSNSAMRSIKPATAK